MNWAICYGRQAKEDAMWLDRAGLRKKAEVLIETIKANPFGIPPPYEKLIGNLNGKYSRRVNRKHRIVYEVSKNDRTVFILRMCTHYAT